MDHPEELYHHGVLGMKWGIHRTPEQLGHKPKSSETRNKKLSSKLSDAKKKRAKRKAAKEKLAKKKEDEKFQKQKAEILKSPTKLYKNREKFTQAEIDEAMRRFRWERDMRDLSMQELKAGKRYVDTVISYTETGIKGYNTAARLYNSFSGKEKKLPYVENVGKSEKKKKKKKDDDDD